jgi:hypothetical protein
LLIIDTGSTDVASDSPLCSAGAAAAPPRHTCYEAFAAICASKVTIPLTSTYMTFSKGQKEAAWGDSVVSTNARRNHFVTS